MLANRYDRPAVENLNVSGQCAVYIRNLCKSYDNGPSVLKKFCMTVEKGTIYGLLGSSGCGKTTILSCVVGLSKWQSGQLLVFGKRPGSRDSGIPGKTLGFMPQDVALYNHMTIQESIHFYGRIYNISNKQLHERWKVLADLLELPGGSRQISDLSGGQKRRTSMALALIHSPKLLVLDEPTVGLDPLLRQRIWGYLRNLASCFGTTIIITTHYIEEARLSNSVGIMRNGRLLVENSPSELLRIYQCLLLEQVVLQLCRKDETSNNDEYLEENTNIQELISSHFNPTGNDEKVSSIVASDGALHGVFREVTVTDCDCSIPNEDLSQNNCYDLIRNTNFYKSLQRIYGMATVVALICIRYPIFLILLLLLPTGKGMFTFVILGAKPLHLTLGVVNNDIRNWTNECDISRHFGNSCDLSALSCKYLNHLKQDNLIDLISFETEKDALNQVHLGKSWGYLTFPENYTQHALDFGVAKRHAFNETIEGSRIHLRLDQSQFVTSFFITKSIYASYFKYLETLYTSCDIGGPSAETPLVFRGPVYGVDDDNYSSYIVVGVYLCGILSLTSLMVALVIIADRKQGTLHRAQVAGLTIYDTIASHFVIQTIIVALQFVIFGVIFHFAFDFKIVGSVWTCLFFCIFTEICATSLGILFGAACRDEVEVIIIEAFMVPTLLLFCGVLWPTESMSKFWQRVSYLLPTTLPTMSVRSIIIRGLDLTHSLVWPGFASLIAWTIVLLIFSVFTSRKKLS